MAEFFVSDPLRIILFSDEVDSEVVEGWLVMGIPLLELVSGPFELSHQ